jgi:Arc/MetJ-type ribon-helix-helix transcriptional regulator
MSYRKLIADCMHELEVDTVSVEAVEAWMRLERGTLDSMSKDEFLEAVEEATVQACMHGDEFNSRLISSMGGDK